MSKFVSRKSLRAKNLFIQIINSNPILFEVILTTDDQFFEQSQTVQVHVFEPAKTETLFERATFLPPVKWAGSLYVNKLFVK